MITPYLPLKDFFFTAIGLGLLFAYGMVGPWAYFFQWSAHTSFIFIAIATTAAVAGLHYILFLAQPITINLSIGFALLCLPVSFISVFPEGLGWALGSAVFETRHMKFFNAYHALACGLIGLILGHQHAQKQIAALEQSKLNELQLMSLHVDLRDNTFESRQQPGAFNKLTVAVVIASGTLFLVASWPVLGNNETGYKALFARFGAMLPSTVFWSLVFAFLGQALALRRLENKIGKQLILRNFEERLRWRHDYVKYHLPAPIRMLNLRLFNQHVETYERSMKNTPLRAEQ